MPTAPPPTSEALRFAAAEIELRHKARRPAPAIVRSVVQGTPQSYRLERDGARVFPEITRFNWGRVDLKWLPEAWLNRPRHKGFHTVRHFFEGQTMDGERRLKSRDWRDGVLKNSAFTGVVTPPQVAANLRQHADEALASAAAVSNFKSHIPNPKELRPRWATSRPSRILAVTTQRKSRPRGDCLRRHSAPPPFSLGARRRSGNSTIRNWGTRSRCGARRAAVPSLAWTVLAATRSSP